MAVYLELSLPPLRTQHQLTDQFMQGLFMDY